MFTSKLDAIVEDEDLQGSICNPQQCPFCHNELGTWDCPIGLDLFSPLCYHKDVIWRIQQHIDDCKRAISSELYH